MTAAQPHIETAQIFDVLRQLARLSVPDDQLAAVSSRLAVVTAESAGLARWEALIQLAEQHGLAVLLSDHLARMCHPVPDRVRQQLLSLKVRHRRANTARQEALGQILDVFEQRSIPATLLKGAALIHQIYPDPALRPMSDIDILTAPDSAIDAQRCLKELGYRVESRIAGVPPDHHHLPVASIVINDVPVYVEIHRDALSGDVKHSIVLDPRDESRQTFTVGGTTAYALNHEDSLRHLCHHTLEPVDTIKLGAVVDLYGYASHFRHEIDFTRLDDTSPFVRNVFQLLHYVTPLPEELHAWVNPPSAPAPRGTGLGYPPMSKTMKSSQHILRRASTLFRAPDWWLHAYYGIAPGRSLVTTRYLHHPVQVMRWLGRRTRATYKSRP